MHKTFKAIWAVLGHLKPKIFSVGQPWWPTFFRDLAPAPSPSCPLPNILALLRPWGLKKQLCQLFFVWQFIVLFICRESVLIFFLLLLLLIRLVDIIIIVSVIIILLHYSILASSIIINFLDGRFWVFRIRIVKWSIPVPWECYHWSNLQGGWRNQTFSFQSWYTFLFIKF